MEGGLQHGCEQDITILALALAARLCDLKIVAFVVHVEKMLTVSNFAKTPDIARHSESHSFLFNFELCSPFQHTNEPRGRRRDNVTKQ